MKLRFFLILALLVFGLSVTLQARGILKKVTFQKGSSSLVIEGSVIRGDADTYVLNARAKQTMTVFIGSMEDNAVFTIVDTATGKALKGAGDKDDAKSWRGNLPSSGDYKITVGGSRGNAEYIIKIAIE